MDIFLNGERFEVEPLKGGFSGQKCGVIDASGKKYLLEKLPETCVVTCGEQFKILKQLEAQKVPMCRPIKQGTYDKGCYILYEWILGENLIDILLSLPETDQYQWGLKAGNILKNMHSVPAPEKLKDWSERFKCEVFDNIDKYRRCKQYFEGDEYIIGYLEKNYHIIKGRPQCYRHGDYMIFNMMVKHDNLIIIDFERQGYGDPWKDFSSILWSAWKSDYFVVGQIYGYFGSEPPKDFFSIIALYLSNYILELFCWAIEKETDFPGELYVVKRRIRDVLSWFDNMKTIIPNWYL